MTRPTHTTEYRVTYRGATVTPLALETYADVERFIARSIELGLDPAEYAVDHRRVTRGPWAPTTVPVPGAPRVARAELCSCGKPAEHVAADLDDPAWACRVPS